MPSPYGPSPNPTFNFDDWLDSSRKTLKFIVSGLTNKPVERRVSRFLTTHLPSQEGPLPEDIAPGSFHEAMYRIAPGLSEEPLIGRRGKTALTLASALGKAAEVPLVPGGFKEAKEALSSRGRTAQRISEALPLTPVDLGLRAVGLSGYLPAIAGSAERLGETAAFRKRVVQEVETLGERLAKSVDPDEIKALGRKLAGYRKALESLPEALPTGPHGLPIESASVALGKTPEIPNVTPEQVRRLPLKHITDLSRRSATVGSETQPIVVPGNRLREITRSLEPEEMGTGRSFEPPREVAGLLESPATLRNREIGHAIGQEPRFNRQNELTRLEHEMDQVVEDALGVSKAERGPHTQKYLALRRRYEELSVPSREPLAVGPGGPELPTEKPFGLLPPPPKTGHVSSFRSSPEIPKGKGRVAAGFIRGMYGRGLFGRIREAGGAPDVPNPVAQGIASRFENYEANRAELMAKARGIAEDAEARFKKLPGDSWRPVVQAMEDSKPGAYVTTGNKDVDENIIKPLLDKRFALYEEARKAGIPIPGITGTPHIDPRIPELILLAESDENKAVEALRKKFAQNRPNMGTPSDEGLRDLAKQLKAISQEYRPVGERTTVPLPNLIQRRALNLPGHLGDSASPLGTKHGFLEAQGLYDEQWANGIAYNKNFGVDAVDLFADLSGSQSRPFQNLVHTTLSRTVGEYPSSESMRWTSQALADWKAMHAAAHLQNFGITNLPQTPKTTFPFSARNVGLASATKNYLGGIKDSLARGGSEFANSVGALSTQTAFTLAALEGRDIGARGIPRLAAELTMTLSGGKKTEVLNNVISVNTGLRDIETLYGRIAQGGKGGLRAEESVRRVLRAMPEEASDLIQQARSGQPLFNEAAATADEAILGTPRVRDAVRRFAYEYAPQTQFRVHPGRMPELASTPLGRWHFQYKNFQHQYLFFLKDEVFGPAVEYAQTAGKSGSIAPMQAWLIGGAIPGGKAFRIGRMLLNGYTPDEIDKKMEGEGDIEGAVNNESVFGGLGLAQQMVEGLADITSKDAFRMIRGFGTMTAPTLGSTLQAAGDILDNPAKGIPRTLVSEFAVSPPLVKGVALRALRPKKEEPMFNLADPFDRKEMSLPQQVWKSKAISSALSDLMAGQPEAASDTTDWAAYWEEQGRLRRERLGAAR